MGKTGFWLRGAKGKLAGTVLYQSGGETIQREIVKPKNPRSDSQMRQRVVFAAASKFYSQAQQNRFTLAFMGKAANQSDFNMFMKENVKEGLEIYPTKQELENPNFPLFNPWIVSKGNLSPVNALRCDDGVDFVTSDVIIANQEEDLFTTWEEVINANKNVDLQMGDILTYTIVLSDANYIDGNIIPGEQPMAWKTNQIIVGADLGDNTLAQYLEANGFYPEGIANSYDDDRRYIGINLAEWHQELYGTEAFSWGSEAAMIVLTRSRKENGKLRVSNSQFLCSPVAQQIYTKLGYDSQLREAINSYKPTESSSIPTEVLEGSIAQNVIRFGSLAYSEEGDFSDGVTLTRGTTKVQEDGAAFSLNIHDDNPSEVGLHKLSLSGTNAATAELEILRYANAGAGTQYATTNIRFRIEDWGQATSVQVKYEGYPNTILTINKPA